MTDAELEAVGVAIDGSSPPPAVTVQQVHLAWLSCPDNEATDGLASLALDAVEHRDATAAVLRAAMAVVHEQARTIDRLREEARNLRRSGNDGGH